MNYTRTVSFTATANQNILNNTAVKNQIKEALGLDEAGYTARLSANPVTSEKLGFKMTFDIVMDADNTIKINGGLAQNLIAGAAYANTGAVDVYSLVVVSSGTGTIAMNILR